ncbi:MAG: DUF4238 domain-containing protein, partial [Ignavibacteriae bacterium]|nr:DUF4238 domain-containing protein [Ignavibacteriota bacterium]
MSTQSDGQATKRQHFVPRFYLRRFLNSKNEVEVLDCAQGKIIAPRGTKGICYEDFFYGIRTGEPDEVSQEIEKAFQQIESSIAASLDGIIFKLVNNEQILIGDKWTIALLMSMLWLRGPIMRKQINEMSEYMMKEVMKRVFDHPQSDALFDRFDNDRG